jgi:hypothetical protein
MPGFMQLLTGVWLWAGLLFFHTFRAPTLYMAALAFTAFGVHWFALGLARVLGGDPRPNEFMAISFAVLSALGIVVFFHAGDWPVGLVFVGLAAVYVCEFFASIFILPRSRRLALDAGATRAVEVQPTLLNIVGERALGFSRLLTGAWLMYLTFAVTLNTTSGFHLPV